MYNSVKETINVPKGVDNNVNLRVSKKGNFSATGPPGDLLVTIKVSSIKEAVYLRHFKINQM